MMKIKTILLTAFLSLVSTATFATDNIEDKIEDIIKTYDIDNLEPKLNESFQAKSTNPPSYLIKERTPQKKPTIPKKEYKMTNVKNGKFVGTGTASYYGKQFHGRKTASGERFNMYALTAASNSLKFGTKVKVTCMSTGKSVVVKINDTGAFTSKYNRIIDLSYGAAQALDMIDRGLTKVKLEVIN